MTVRANLPTLGKVEIAKADVAGKTGNKEDEKMNPLLVISRSNELGLSRNELVRRAGYTRASVVLNGLVKESSEAHEDSS